MSFPSLGRRVSEDGRDEFERLRQRNGSFASSIGYASISDEVLSTPQESTEIPNSVAEWQAKQERKQQRYADKLRSLSDRLTTRGAIGRGKRIRRKASASSSEKSDASPGFLGRAIDEVDAAFARFDNVITDVCTGEMCCVKVAIEQDDQSVCTPKLDNTRSGNLELKQDDDTFLLENGLSSDDSLSSIEGSHM